MVAVRFPTDKIPITDESFSVSWDMEDKEYIQKRYFGNIHKCKMLGLLHPNNATLKALKTQLVEEFRERIRRRYNDQTVYDFNMKNRHFEPQGIGYKYDRVLNTGIQVMFETFTGEGAVQDWHFAAGDGISDTFPNTKTLDHEVIRVSMMDSDTGFMTAAGTTLNSAGLIAETIPTFQIKEVGAVNNDGGIDDETNARKTDVFLFRSVFPSTDIVTHTQNTNFTTIVHAIYSKSI